MKKVLVNNYARDFAGRGYIVITYANGMTKILYTPFNVTDNVRSVRTVAQKFMADTEKFDAVSDQKKAVVEIYAQSSNYTPKNVTPTNAILNVQDVYDASVAPFGRKNNFM